VWAKPQEFDPMSLTRIAGCAGFTLFSTGWIFVLFLSAACFYAEYDGIIRGHVTSFPRPQMGVDLGIIGAIWCAIVMATHAALLLRLSSKFRSSSQAALDKL
jgi:hypothetical protein